jgi:hypothetical protein
MIVKTSIIYSSVVSSNAYTALLVHFQGRLSENSLAKTPEQTMSWCSISQTVLTNPFVDPGGFPLRLCLNRSRSSHCILAWLNCIRWPLMWLNNIHLTAWFCLFVFAVDLHTILNFSSLCILLVAISAAARWGFWARRCSWVSCVAEFEVLSGAMFY